MTSPRLPPLPPGRPRYHSEPGSGITLEVYNALRDQHSDISELRGELKDHVAATERGFADVRLALAQNGSTQRTETLKVIAGAVVAIVIAVAGSRAVAPTPAPTQTVIQRSAFDRELEACGKLEGVAAATCISDAAQRAAGKTP